MSKFVKKLTAVVIMTCMLVAAVGCGGPKKQSVTCTQEQDGITVEMVLDAEDDNIVKMTQTSSIPLDGYTEEQASAMEEMLKAAKDTFEGIDGVEYNTEKTDKVLKATVSIKTDEKTLKAVADQGLFDDLDSDDLSLEKAKKSLADEGWTIK